MSALRPSAPFFQYSHCVYFSALCPHTVIQYDINGYIKPQQIVFISSS